MPMCRATWHIVVSIRRYLSNLCKRHLGKKHALHPQSLTGQVCFVPSAVPVTQIHHRIPHVPHRRHLLGADAGGSTIDHPGASIPRGCRPPGITTSGLRRTRELLQRGRVLAESAPEIPFWQHWRMLSDQDDAPAPSAISRLAKRRQTLFAVLVGVNIREPIAITVRSILEKYRACICGCAFLVCLRCAIDS